MLHSLPDYQLAKQQAAKEYAEGLFLPQDLGRPGMDETLRCYADDFMRGAEYMRSSRRLTDSEIDAAALRYARQVLEDPDGNDDALADVADSFAEGACWYRRNYVTPIGVVQDRLWLAGLFIGLGIMAVWIAKFVFTHG